MTEKTTPVPQVGTPAPGFTLNDGHGNLRRLEDYRGQWVVLYFYPKDATSGCTKQACAFRDELGAKKPLNAVVLGVSPDGEASHAKFSAAEQLNFPLLADVEQTACKAYGVWQEKSMYGRKYFGVVRTTFLIDPAGVIRQRWDKVKVPGHAADVRSELQAASE